MRLAQSLFSKLGDSPKHIKKKNRQSTALCLSNLAEYIDELCNKHVKRKYTDDYLIGAIFKLEVSYKTDSEVNQYCKSQLFIANSWLNSLINIIKENGNFNHASIIKHKHHITDYLFDIKPFIEYLERKSNKDYIFFDGGKYYGQKAWQVFRESKVLYWHSSSNKNYLTHRSNISLSVFTLRQSLELKFKSILGLSDIYDKSNASAKIKHDYIPDFLDRNLSELDVNYNSLKYIIKIYKRTNVTIHTGIIPHIWEQDFALNYCAGLFKPDAAKPSGAWSLYSSVKIKNYDILIKKFMDEFCKKYSDNYWCFEFTNPEAVILTTP